MMKFKRKFVISVVVCLFLSGSASAYVGSRNFSDNFDGPTMTNWDAIDPCDPGAYNGVGQYDLVDDQGIERYIEEGAFNVQVDLVDIDLHGDLLGSNDEIGTLNVSLGDAGERLHAVAYGYDNGYDILGVGTGDPCDPYVWSPWIADLTTLSLEFQWDPVANTVSAWAAINGGTMDLYLDNLASHDLGNDVMHESIYLVPTTGTPLASLDSYNIVPEPATMMLLGLGGLLIRRKH